MQRLFSTFPDGLPGAGLLCLRLAAILPLRSAIIGAVSAGVDVVTLQLVAASAAALLLAGLWTPVAGVLLAIAEVLLALSHSGDPWIHIVIGTLGAALAMLGPGAWSVDARLFGRKRIQIPQR